MKQALWLVLVITGSIAAYGQHTEFSVQAGSGLFGFRGPGASSGTTLLVTDFSSYHALENPYGRSSGFSYSLTGQVQHITGKSFLYGVQAGFESLTSQVAVILVSGGLFYPYATNDRARLRIQYATLHPFIGRRFGNDRVSIDATAGVDVSTGLTERLLGETTSNGSSFTTPYDSRPLPAVDVRPRLNLTGYYRAFGLTIGYSHGLTTYPNDPFGAAKITSRMWRVGVVYRLARRA